MVEQVASLAVLGAAHVRLDPAQRTAARDRLNKGAERRGVDGVAEGEKSWEESELRGGEAGEVGEVASLVDLRCR